MTPNPAEAQYRSPEGTQHHASTPPHADARRSPGTAGRNEPVRALLIPQASPGACWAQKRQPHPAVLRLPRRLQAASDQLPAVLRPVAAARAAGRAGRGGGGGVSRRVAVPQAAVGAAERGPLRRGALRRRRRGRRQQHAGAAGSRGGPVRGVTGHLQAAGNRESVTHEPRVASLSCRPQQKSVPSKIRHRR